jgi:hypothetical protein
VQQISGRWQRDGQGGNMNIISLFSHPQTCAVFWDSSWQAFYWLAASI